MRALIQGLDQQASWDRYLRGEGEGRNRRQVQRTIGWIKEAFAAAARREQRPGTARLILLDPSRFDATVRPARPSLEDFALSQGLEEFSEAEQVDAYEQAYPPERSSQRGRGEHSQLSRRARVIARQLEALRWLEARESREPTGIDAVDAWLAQGVAERLRRVEIVTLAQLIAHINQQGLSWWRTMPGIGEGKAALVHAWLEAHEISIGHRITITNLVPVTEAECNLVPLERLVLPAGLDGREGVSGRTTTACLHTAVTDLDAVQVWLATGGRTGSKGRILGANTARSYRKEAERLLLWCVFERRLALSSLAANDLDAYLAFLAAPPAAWCGPRHTLRGSTSWRPIEGPLSSGAIGQARTILHGMFAFLVEQRWLDVNPLSRA